MSAVDEIHRRIGRNLARYQQIEFSLKFCLPYMHPNGSKQGIESLRRYQKAVGKQTLGQLVDALEESAEIPDGFFENALKKAVDARNELVHHLFQIPGINLLSDSASENLIRYLDDQLKRRESCLSTPARCR